MKRHLEISLYALPLFISGINDSARAEIVVTVLINVVAIYMSQRSNTNVQNVKETIDRDRRITYRKLSNEVGFEFA